MNPSTAPRASRRAGAASRVRIRPKSCASIEGVAFAHWDPIRDLLAIQQRLDHLAPTSSGWLPPVDLHETPESYVVTAEVPGVAREDIEIRVNNGWLTLAGTRRETGRT